MAASVTTAKGFAKSHALEMQIIGPFCLSQFALKIETCEFEPSLRSGKFTIRYQQSIPQMYAIAQVTGELWGKGLCVAHPPKSVLNIRRQMRQISVSIRMLLPEVCWPHCRPGVGISPVWPCPWSAELAKLLVERLKSKLFLKLSLFH